MSNGIQLLILRRVGRERRRVADRLPLGFGVSLGGIPSGGLESRASLLDGRCGSHEGGPPPRTRPRVPRRWRVSDKHCSLPHDDVSNEYLKTLQKKKAHLALCLQPSVENTLMRFLVGPFAFRMEQKQGGLRWWSQNLTGQCRSTLCDIIEGPVPQKAVHG